MSRIGTRWPSVVLGAILSVGVLGGVVAAAGAAKQPVEWETYRSGRPSYSLGSYWPQYDCKQAGRWWDFDWKVRINLNASYDPDKMRIYSSHRDVQRAFEGKSPMGVDLTSQTPALCLGITDVQAAGGMEVVKRNMTVWIK